MDSVTPGGLFENKREEGSHNILSERLGDGELEYVEIFSKEGEAHFFALLRV